ncbi:hypothetical protein OIU79_029687 [Salix purpurea]|uniref:Protein kinase domain-containing protein n=1 Tax=Salix purpurea TaxID=77065 RepID=A0A9Q0ZVN6_SALPP|nr:hypothetical protein OIU79_029687 [Salix purpurea]
MDRTLIWVLPIFIFLIFPKSSSEDENVRKALVQFMEKLSAGHEQNDQNRGWDISSDPCNSTWKGVDCLGSQNVKRIVLNKFNLTGIFDAASVCTAKSLLVLSLKENNISGVIPDEIGNCKRLSHLYVGGNRFTGDIPDTISQLRNLKRLDISNNNFSGELPDMSRIPGLLTFFAENNHISGAIPDFDFSYLQEFSVANNNFSGPIPDVKKQVRGRQLHRETVKVVKKGKVENESKEPSSNSSESKTGGNRSQYSITSAEAGTTSSSLLVLPSPVVKDLKFEDLLRAPAELLGRGKDGSSYKAMLDSATILAVKRMKDLGISAEEFKSRLQRIGQVKHPRVLPPVAFYCSEQEKLLVHAYQQNGSLFKLLHGSQNGQVFDWGSRLNIAASIAETLAYMHEQLQEDGIAHGNLKSTNILFNNKMEPCISEYALGRNVAYSTFKLDVYGYGVVLLELLTGKSVQNKGFDLASWVNSVVREEWTAEVFDRALISEGACEERMVKLLQVAQKCINPSPNERPSTDQISAMINTIKEDEERSITAEP